MFSLSFNGDLERWDVGRVKRFAFTFGFTESFQGLGLSAWNTSRVQTLSQTFEASSAFDANLSRWDVARVVDFSNAFNSAKAFTGKGLSRWNTSSAEAMWRMFMSTPLFSADLSSWDVGNVVEMTEMVRLLTPCL
jgi:Mycoplasma protein of unknown function, DUF285